MSHLPVALFRAHSYRSWNEHVKPESASVGEGRCCKTRCSKSGLDLLRCDKWLRAMGCSSQSHGKNRLSSDALCRSSLRCGSRAPWLFFDYGESTAALARTRGGNFCAPWNRRRAASHSRAGRLASRPSWRAKCRSCPPPARRRVAAALRGADVVIIGSLGVIEYKLAALPQIRNTEALKGKRVGISRFGSFTDFASRRVLRHIGLNPEKDVVLLQTGIAGATQRLMAMFNGTMDATLTQVDTILLAQIKLGKEVSVLGGLLETGYRATGGDIMTSRRFLKEKPDVARRFMMAIVEGISYGAHPERSRLAHDQ